MGARRGRPDTVPYQGKKFGALGAANVKASCAPWSPAQRRRRATERSDTGSPGTSGRAGKAKLGARISLYRRLQEMETGCRAPGAGNSQIGAITALKT